MKLQQALKLALDELRMQMLGVQVLFGFQFQGLFQDKFAALPAAGPVSQAARGSGRGGHATLTARLRRPCRLH